MEIMEKFILFALGLMIACPIAYIIYVIGKKILMNLKMTLSFWSKEFFELENEIKSLKQRIFELEDEVKKLKE